MRSDKIMLALFILILAAFSVGLIRLFSLRFEAGDIYPPYSSLRSDPLGCRAFYDSINETGRYKVKRNHLPVEQIKTDGNDTWIIAGVNLIDVLNVPQTESDVLNRLVTSGGSLIVGFYPYTSGQNKKKDSSTKPGKESKPAKTLDEKSGKPAPDKKKTEKNDQNTKPDNNDDKDKKDEESFGFKKVNLTDLWGFNDDVQTYDKDKAVANPLKKNADKFGLVGQSWHSAMVFKELSPEWTPVYTLNGKPVLIERPLGKGRIILSSDSYFMSNEALKKEANPALLAYLVRDRKTVVFDESHLGIESQDGISGLILKYRLTYFAAALVLFGLLFAWKNAAYFIPTKDEPESRDVSDRDQASGLASLYKRHIPSSKILTLCVDEWEKPMTLGHGAKNITPETRKLIRTTAERFEKGENPDPAAGYREIHRLLSEGKKT